MINVVFGFIYIIRRPIIQNGKQCNISSRTTMLIQISNPNKWTEKVPQLHRQLSSKSSHYRMILISGKTQKWSKNRKRWEFTYGASH